MVGGCDRRVGRCGGVCVGFDVHVGCGKLELWPVAGDDGGDQAMSDQPCVHAPKSKIFHRIWYNLTGSYTDRVNSSNE